MQFISMSCITMDITVITINLELRAVFDLHGVECNVNKHGNFYGNKVVFECICNCYFFIFKHICKNLSVRKVHTII